MHSLAGTAELALHLEAVAAPTPGNVDRERDHPDLTLEQFLAGAVGARPGLAAAADGEAVGPAFEQAVEGMSAQEGGNTQFGALLLLVPLVRAAAEGSLSSSGAADVAERTTVADAAAFYRAFDHVDVRVDDPPEGMEPLDVRRGSDAVPAVERRSLTLQDVLAASADRDGVAREWTTGFERTFETARRLASPDTDDPVGAWIGATDRLVERGARTQLAMLAERPDSLIRTARDNATADAVRDRAAELLPTAVGDRPDPDEVEAFAADLVERGLNPGMTADQLGAGLFVALHRGEVSV